MVGGTQGALPMALSGASGAIDVIADGVSSGSRSWGTI